MAAHGTSTRTEASIEDTENFAEIAGAQPNWAITTKEADLCSKTTDDCSKTGCCKTTGYKYIKENTGGKYMKYCPDLVSALSLETPKRGPPCAASQCTPKILAALRRAIELDLLKEQAEEKVSLFGCDKASVYGDVVVSAGPLTVMKVEDVDNDFHFARENTWELGSTQVCIPKCLAIAVKGDYADYDWTVKVDADCVFFLHQLVDCIKLLPAAPTGAFLANCEGVEYGFFGNLEVFSKTAFSILLANVDTCKTKIENLEDWYPEGQIRSHGRGPVCRDVPEEEWSGRD